MKIAVYAIAKNEEKFARRWARSCAEADYRIVLDTGSSDRTPEKLRENGVTVHKTTHAAFRFDTARNEALSHVPGDADLCVSLDLDEVLSPGWRLALEKVWQPGVTTRGRYLHVSQWEDDGITPKESTFQEKIHSRHDYEWRFPVHEVPWPKSKIAGKESRLFLENLRILHFSDPEKSRGLYFDLLKLAIAEEPEEPRHVFFLGQELIRHERFEEAIARLEEYLRMAKSFDAGRERERAMALRLIAYSHKQLDHSLEIVISHLYKAAVESPHERENWMNLSEAMAEAGNWANCFAAAINGLRRTDPRQSLFLDPQAWQSDKLQTLAAFSARKLGIPLEELPKWAG